MEYGLYEAFEMGASFEEILEMAEISSNEWEREEEA